MSAFILTAIVGLVFLYGVYLALDRIPRDLPRYDREPGDEQ